LLFPSSSSFPLPLSLLCLTPSMRQEVINEKEELIETRRHIHRNPELKFEEHETRKLIEKKLRSYGLEIHPSPLATTGLVAFLRGNGSQKDRINLALRADMDAL